MDSSESALGAEFLLTKSGCYDIIKMPTAKVYFEMNTENRPLCSKKAIENKFKQCIASIAQHLVSFFKNVWQGLQSCIQMFYKRFSLKMLTTFAMNILNMIR